MKQEIIICQNCGLLISEGKLYEIKDEVVLKDDGIVFECPYCQEIIRHKWQHKSKNETAQK